MKHGTLTLITSACLLGSTALAQQNRPAGDTPPGNRPATGTEQRGTVDRITQGAKNIVTEMKFEDLPSAVQATVRQQSGGTKINDIDREDRTGRTIYEIEFDKDGNNNEIHVAEDGTLLPEDNASIAGAKTDGERSRVRGQADTKFADLPAAVKRTAQQHGAESDIEDIDRETRDGKTVYEIEFRREGPNREIVIAEDGALIRTAGAVGRPATPRDSSIGNDGTAVPRPRTPANDTK
jgi:uncharacterized membrane protein YkoI